MTIFKAYDIRGLYPEQINEQLMEKIGRAFADFIEGDNIAVGFDMRTSSPSLFDAFSKGVIKQGKNVINFGLCSTPGAYFACNFLKADGMAMITASHNPGNYNGVKMTREKAIPISGATGIKDIEKAVLDNNFKEVDNQGEIKQVNILSDYKKFLLSFVKDMGSLNVVVDAANGMGAQDYEQIIDSIPVKTTKMFFDIDGSFPNHDANPMAKGATDDLIKSVIDNNADLGIAFDGDADRVFFVDESGSLLQSDFITALISEELLKYHKGDNILYDLRSSWIVPEKIKEYGGNPIMCRVGHSFIKEMMRENNGLFAGELSGHFYFKDAFTTDSGIITAIWVLNLLSASGKKMSELVKDLKKYHSSGEINSKVDNTDAKMKELEEKYSDGKISHLDGIRIDFDDYWFNVRASNTEPLLRLNLEAKTKDLMESKRDEILGLIRSN